MEKRVTRRSPFVPARRMGLRSVALASALTACTWLGTAADGEFEWVNSTFPGREGAACAPTLLGSIILGGRGADGAVIPDAWLTTSHGNSWRAVSVPSDVAARADAGMAAFPSTAASIVAGGVDGDGKALSDSWITHDGGISWTRGPDLPGPRVGAAVVATTSLGVLVVAGATDAGLSSLSADVLAVGSPAAGAWSQVATQGDLTPRAFAAATSLSPTVTTSSPILLPGDTVLLVGGIGPNGVAIDEVLRSDDGGRTWARVATGAFPARSRAVLLPLAEPGAAILAGGTPNPAGQHAVAWTGDSDTAAWQTLDGGHSWNATAVHGVDRSGACGVAHAHIQATPAQTLWDDPGTTRALSGQLATMILGGRDAGGNLAASAAGKVSTETLSAVLREPWRARGGHATVLLPNGAVLLIGGSPTRVTQGSTGSDAAATSPSTRSLNWWSDKLDSAACTSNGGATWTPRRAPPDWGLRVGIAAVLATDGNAFVAGGCDPMSGTARGDMYLSADSGFSWREVAAQTGRWSPRCGHSMASVDGVGVIVFGGVTQAGAVAGDSWLTGDGGVSWRGSSAASDAAWPQARAYGSMTHLPHGGAVLLGGCTQNGSALADVWVTADGGASWTQQAAPPWAPRCGHAVAASIGAAASILVFGGVTSWAPSVAWPPGSRQGASLLGDAWVAPRDYLGAWSLLYRVPTWAPRGSASAVALLDGSVLLTGGFTANGTASGELMQSGDGGGHWFDPAVSMRQWQGASAAQLPRVNAGLGASAAAFGDDMLVTFGGWRDQALQDGVWTAPSWSAGRHPLDRWNTSQSEWSGTLEDAGAAVVSGCAACVIEAEGLRVAHPEEWGPYLLVTGGRLGSTFALLGAVWRVFGDGSVLNISPTEMPGALLERHSLAMATASSPRAGNLAAPVVLVTSGRQSRGAPATSAAFTTDGGRVWWEAKGVELPPRFGVAAVGSTVGTAEWLLLGGAGAYNLQPVAEVWRIVGPAWGTGRSTFGSSLLTAAAPFGTRYAAQAFTTPFGLVCVAGGLRTPTTPAKDVWCTRNWGVDWTLALAQERDLGSRFATSWMPADVEATLVGGTAALARRIALTHGVILTPQAGARWVAGRTYPLHWRLPARPLPTDATSVLLTLSCVNASGLPDPSPLVALASTVAPLSNTTASFTVPTALGRPGACAGMAQSPLSNTVAWSTRVARADGTPVGDGPILVSGPFHLAPSLEVRTVPCEPGDPVDSAAIGGRVCLRVWTQGLEPLRASAVLFSNTSAFAPLYKAAGGNATTVELVQGGSVLLSAPGGPSALWVSRIPATATPGTYLLAVQEDGGSAGTPVPARALASVALQRLEVLCAAGTTPSVGPSCLPCASGYYMPETLGVNATDAPCFPCPPGTYGNGTGKATAEEACAPCPRGSFSSHVAALRCESCPPGTRPGGVQATNASAGCLPCPAGTFSSGQAVPGLHFVGPATCTPCPVGTFNPRARADRLGDCLPCDPGRTTAKIGASSADSCVCVKGTVAVGDQCRTCQLGLNCSAADMTGPTVWTEASFWRAERAPLEPTPCLHPPACPGGPLAAAPRANRTQCAPGHTGVLCEVCRPGYARAEGTTASGLPCVQCKASTTALATAELGVALTLLFSGTVMLVLDWGPLRRHARACSRCLPSRRRGSGASATEGTELSGTDSVPDIAVFAADREDTRSTGYRLVNDDGEDSFDDGSSIEKASAVVAPGAGKARPPRRVNTSVASLRAPGALGRARAGPTSWAFASVPAMHDAPGRASSGNTAPSSEGGDSDDIRTWTSRRTSVLERRHRTTGRTPGGKSTASALLVRERGMVSFASRTILSFVQLSAIALHVATTSRPLASRTHQASSGGLSRLLQLSILDVWAAFPVGCVVGHVGFTQRLLMCTVGPPVVWACGLVGVWMMRKMGASPRKADVTLSTLIITVVLLFPLATRTALQAFRCYQLPDGRAFLLADFSVACDPSDPSYRALEIIGASMAVLHAVVVPGILTAILLAARRAMRAAPQHTLTLLALPPGWAWLRFMTSGTQVRHAHFEMLHFAHKAGAVALFTFFTPTDPVHSSGFPAVAVLAWTMVVLLVLIYERPFARRGDLLGATVSQGFFMVVLLWCAARMDGETTLSEEAAFLFVVLGAIIQAGTFAAASYRRRHRIPAASRYKSMTTS